jgi:hypothetical protein
MPGALGQRGLSAVPLSPLPAPCCIPLTLLQSQEQGVLQQAGWQVSPPPLVPGLGEGKSVGIQREGCEVALQRGSPALPLASAAALSVFLQPRPTATSSSVKWGQQQPHLPGEAAVRVETKPGKPLGSSPEERAVLLLPGHGQPSLWDGAALGAGRFSPSRVG